MATKNTSYPWNEQEFFKQFRACFFKVQVFATNKVAYIIYQLCIVVTLLELELNGEELQICLIFNNFVLTVLL